jgi:hypothetical protein
MKEREIIADNLSKAGFSWGCVSAIDREGRTIWITDAHRDDGRRFVVDADEKLAAFLELESAIRDGVNCLDKLAGFIELAGYENTHSTSSNRTSSPRIRVFAKSASSGPATGRRLSWRQHR